MKEELELPDMPEKYRFKIVPTYEKTGVIVYLQRRVIICFWKTVSMGVVSQYEAKANMLNKAIERKAGELWQSEEENSRYYDETYRLSGIYRKKR